MTLLNNDKNKVQRKLGKINFMVAIIAVFAVISTLILVSTLTSANTIKNKVFYTNSDTQVNIKMDNSEKGDNIALFTKIGSRYILIKDGEKNKVYEVNEKTGGVDIDVDLKGKNSEFVYAAIIPKGQDVSNFENGLEEDFQKHNTEVIGITIYPMRSSIINCINNENKEILTTLKVPDGVKVDSVKEFQWKINDGNWSTYDPANNIKITQNCILYAKFIDKDGVESPVESKEIKNINNENNLQIEMPNGNINVKANDIITTKFKVNDTIEGINSQDKSITFRLLEVNDKNELTNIASKEITSSEKDKDGYLKAKFKFVEDKDTSIAAYETDGESILAKLKENESKILCTVKVKDKLGNEIPAEEESKIFYYDMREPEIIIQKKEPSDIKYCKSDDELVAKFTVNDVSDIDINKIMINGTTTSIIEKSLKDGIYTFTFKAKDSQVTTDGVITPEITVEDSLGNVGKNVADSGLKFDDTKPSLINKSFEKVSENKDGNSLSKAYVKDGDKIRIKVKLEDVQSGIDNKKIVINIGDNKNIFSNTNSVIKDCGDGYYEAEFKVEDPGISTEQNSGFRYKIESTDNVGNSFSEIGDIEGIKYDSIKPTCSNLKIEKTTSTDNQNTNIIKDGDKFKVSFKLNDNESGISENNVKIKLSNNQEITIPKEEQNKIINEDNFEFEYEVNGSGANGYKPQENSEIKIEEIKFTDIAGNEVDLNNLKYPDEVNQGEKKQIITDKIIYYAPINDLNEVVKSTNKNVSIVKNGEEIVINFKSTHPVNIKDCKFEGTSVDATKGLKITSGSNNMEWELRYAVQGKTNDLENIDFQFSVYDNAGNKPLEVTDEKEKNKIKYYAPIQVSDVVIKSNNANDQNKYAKNGDSITVSFKTNHPTKISKSNEFNENSNMVIASEQLKLDNSNYNKEYTFTKEIHGGELEDLSVIPFEFVVGDEAENNVISINNTSEGVTNSIQYFKPIELTSSVTTSSSNQDYVKNGDSIALNIVTNHNTKIETASICNREDVKKSSEEATTQTIGYPISVDEAGIPEGEINCTASVSDLAGNKQQVTQIPRKIKYDRTLPTIAILPDFSGFTNKEINYNTVFADENIDSKEISLKINGTEQLSDEEKTNASANKSYSKDLMLSEEGEYYIDGTISDLASNRCGSNIKSKIVIDKTNPNITLNRVEVDKPMAFKKSFIISENLNIEERYIKDIICKVTDSTGSYDWSVEEPIVNDGKKTIDLLATDMSGNSSQEVVYDIYIDATNPKAKIKDTVSNKDLDLEGNNNEFVSKVNLNCSLENLSVGNEEPDKFTKVQVLDENDNVVIDMLNDTKPVDGVYACELKTFGKYKLKAEAMDSVGNITDPLEYSFTLKDKSVFVKLYENKPVFYSTSAMLIVAIFSVATLSISNVNKKRKAVK